MMLDTTIAHYKLTAKLGQGGMGEVYRATDTKLGREVAIKVLPEALASDAERLARFQREAMLLASLNHSNIAAIYGLEESGTSKALVLELVEGDTLEDRLRRGPIAVEDAVETCLGIAEALEAAHEKGIIHRDLKPANVKFTSDGKVKVLDFGVAKALESEPESMASTETLIDSPTLTADYTKPGTILGTAAYMSPEQARGKGLDKRTDIWSFGCVLFECLTGKKLFQGEDVSETLASIIKEDPDWALLPNNTPPAIQLLLRKCVSKDRKRRLQDVGDARVDLAEAIEDPSNSYVRLNDEELTESRVNCGGWLGIGIAVILTGLVASVLVWNMKPVSEPPGVKRSEILIAGKFRLSSRGNALALSRDGKRLVYNLYDGGGGLRVRNLESGEDTRIDGSQFDLECSPFLSPDGADVGMIHDDKLVRVPITGGTPRVIAGGVSWSGFRGASWGEDGNIVFAELASPLMLVSEEGGESKELTDLGNDAAHVFPQLLPDGEHVLFIAVKRMVASNVGRAEVLNLETGEREVLGIGECEYARYVSSGHLIFTKGTDVFAIGWDAESRDVVGKGERILGGVKHSSWRSQIDVSEEGTLIYEAELGVGSRSLVWVEPTGEVEQFTLRSGEWDSFALSPDEKKVVVEEEGDLYIIEQVSEGYDQKRAFVTGASRPLWSRDGEWLYFLTEVGGRAEIWKKKAGFLPGRGELVYAHERGFSGNPSTLSAEYLMFSRRGEGGDYDILRFDLGGEIKAAKVLYGEDYSEGWPQISPDGKWLAYYTREVGSEIYVASMDGNSGGQMVSNGGGYRPRWSGSGQEIYYTWGNRILSVRVKDGEGRLVRNAPNEVIDLPFEIYRSQWTVSENGERFLMLVDSAELAEGSSENGVNGEDGDDLREPTHLKIVYNWFTELNEMVPLNGE